MDSRVRQWLSPEELAEELGVPLGSVYQWNHKAVDAWLAANTQLAG
jgi:DNA-directed RNA polymerase specialized sigma24 family protein